MRFQFDGNQAYQLRAIEATADLFRGQPRATVDYDVFEMGELLGPVAAILVGDIFIGVVQIGRAILGAMGVAGDEMDQARLHQLLRVLLRMAAEAASIAARAGLPPPTREQLFDPKLNIAVGVAEYAQKLAAEHGNTTLAIAAYNAGEDAVRRFGGIPPFPETQDYVKKVLSLYR